MLASWTDVTDRLYYYGNDKEFTCVMLQGSLMHISLIHVSHNEFLSAHRSRVL